MKHALLALALLASPALAAPVVICDPSGLVAGFDRSANTPEYTERTDALISPPSLSLMASVPRQHVLCVGSPGAWSDVREMTQQEKDALAAEQTAAADAALRADACAQLDGPTGLTLRALVSALLDEINTLRQRASLPPRTMAQAKTAICGAVNAGGVDE